MYSSLYFVMRISLELTMPRAKIPKPVRHRPCSQQTAGQRQAFCVPADAEVGRRFMGTARGPDERFWGCGIAARGGFGALRNRRPEPFGDGESRLIAWQ